MFCQKKISKQSSPREASLTQVPLIQACGRGTTQVPGRVRPRGHFLLPTPPDCPTSSAAEHSPGTVCGHREGHCLADERVQLRDFCLHLQTGSLAGSTPAIVLSSQVNIPGKDAPTSLMNVSYVPELSATGT
uniref:Uncharacterized protein n=1 Tax=Myotis myotis TaxID=51298 RepID=A0A7J8AMB1_MYOMY|nr:hypothetical protein mMyoMyo1_007913 [Myotis myotis]